MTASTLSTQQKRQKKLEILNLLNLDKHNEAHLKYWEGKTWHFLGFGGKAVAFGNTTYRIPTRVAYMMEVAYTELSKQEGSVESFINALERARLVGLDANHPGTPLVRAYTTELNRPSFFRDPDTTRLYETPIEPNRFSEQLSPS